MTKICHVTSAHSSNDTRIFYKECTSLVNAGYEVFLVARGADRKENGVHIIGIDHPSGGRITRMTDFAKKAYNAALDIDAEFYHIHDPELLPYALRLKMKGKKVIYDAHENYPAQIMKKHYIPKILRGAVSKCFRLYETFVSRRIDAVIFPCSINGENIFAGRCKCFAYIDNVPLFDESKASPPKAAHVFSVCCAGTLSPERGISELVIAADRAGVRLMLAGRFQPEQYHERIKSMPEYRCVDYRGYIAERSKLLGFIQEADIGASTLLNVGQYYHADNLPTKVYEYMCSGLPVIMSDSAYAKRFVAENKVGLCVDPSSPENIVEAIEYLRYHPKEAKQMGEAGRETVKATLNWVAQEKKLIELYRKIDS